MPPQKGALADAWDDDWETIADVNLHPSSMQQTAHIV